MATLEELTIVINANTSAVTKATAEINRFEKSNIKSVKAINDAYKKNTKELEKVVKGVKKKSTVEKSSVKSLTKLERQQNRQSKTLASAKQKFLNYSSSVRRSGMEQDKINDLLQKGRSAFGSITRTMNTAKTTTTKFTEAQIKFNEKIGEGKRRLSEFNSVVRKSELKKRAKDTKEFTKRMEELSKSAQIALGPLSGVASRITAFTSLMKSGAAPFAIFISTVIAFSVVLFKSAKATAQFQSEILRIQAIIQATGSAAKISVEEVAVIADRLGEATLTTESAARRAAAVLLTFPSVPRERLEEVLTLSQDLASVMGLELSSAAAQLGRALEDPAGSLDTLRRAGVIFSEQEKELIKDLVELNQVADAQRIILNNLNTTVGGAGIREAKGLAGAWDTLTERMTDFLNIAGSVLNKPLTKFLRDIGDSMKTMTTQTNIARSAGVLFGQTLLLIRGAISLLSATFEGFSAIAFATGLTNLKNVVTAIVQEIVPELKSQKRLEEQILIVSAEEAFAKQVLFGVSRDIVALGKEEVRLKALGARITEQEGIQLRSLPAQFRIFHREQVKAENVLFILTRRRIKFENQLKATKKFTTPFDEAAAQIASNLKLVGVNNKAAQEKKEKDNKEITERTARNKEVQAEIASFDNEVLSKAAIRLEKFNEKLEKERERANTKELKMLKDLRTKIDDADNAELQRQRLFFETRQKILGEDQAKRNKEILDKVVAEDKAEQETIEREISADKESEQLEKEHNDEQFKIARAGFLDRRKIFQEGEKEKLKEQKLNDVASEQNLRFHIDKENKIRKEATKAQKIVDDAAKRERETEITLRDNFADSLADSFVRIAVEGERTRDVLRDLGKSIVSLIVKTQIFNALANAFGSPTQRNVIPFQTNLSSPPADFVEPPLVLAHGGSIRRNQMALVGERGPELFVPNSGGKVIPNNKLGGSGDTKVNVTIINQNDSNVTVKETQSGDSAIDIEVIIANIVAGDIRNNGLTAQAINDSFTSRPQVLRR